MRELDTLLRTFVDAEAQRLSETEMAVFEGILELPDPVLHSYLLGRSVAADAATVAFIERIRASVRAEA